MTSTARVRTMTIERAAPHEAPPPTQSRTQTRRDRCVGPAWARRRRSRRARAGRGCALR
jgi:hypothetical protein